jgi:hypothetical protein
MMAQKLLRPLSCLSARRATEFAFVILPADFASGIAAEPQKMWSFANDCKFDSSLVSSVASFDDRDASIYKGNLDESRLGFCWISPSLIL